MRTAADRAAHLRTPRGWTLQGEYVDHGLSGERDTRPALSRLLDAARRRAIDGVVVWKLDRWGRSMAHIVSSIQELDGLGVRFVVKLAPRRTVHTYLCFRPTRYMC